VSPDTLADFPRIYEVYHGKVLAYATKLIGPGEAEDVTQEVFIKIRRSLDTLSDPEKLTSWVYTITLNTVRDALRARASRIEPAAGTVGTEAGEQADLRGRTPEELAIRHEMIACYVEYVKQLPPSYYEVYTLSEFEHLSNEDIARRLSLSVGTVKIRLHRARTRLNEELRRNCQCYYNERGELMGEPRVR